MPETRTITTYEYPEWLGPDEKTLDKAKITKTTYIVSDEELAEERKAQQRANMFGEIENLSARLTILEDKLNGHNSKPISK